MAAALMKLLSAASLTAISHGVTPSVLTDNSPKDKKVLLNSRAKTNGGHDGFTIPEHPSDEQIAEWQDWVDGKTGEAITRVGEIMDNSDMQNIVPGLNSSLFDEEIEEGQTINDLRIPLDELFNSFDLDNISAQLPEADRIELKKNFTDGLNTLMREAAKEENIQEARDQIDLLVGEYQRGIDQFWNESQGAVTEYLDDPVFTDVSKKFGKEMARHVKDVIEATRSFRDSVDKHDLSGDLVENLLDQLPADFPLELDDDAIDELKAHIQDIIDLPGYLPLRDRVFGREADEDGLLGYTMDALEDLELYPTELERDFEKVIDPALSEVEDETGLDLEEELDDLGNWVGGEVQPTTDPNGEDSMARVQHGRIGWLTTSSLFIWTWFVQ